MDNCNLLVTRLFISAARKMYVQHKVYKDPGCSWTVAYIRSETTIKWLLHSYAKNTELTPEHSASRKAATVPSVLAALFWLWRNIQQQLETTLNPGFIKTSAVYNSVTHFKEARLDMLERCRHIARVHQIRTIYRNMAAGWIRITDSKARNENHSYSTRSKK